MPNGEIFAKAIRDARIVLTFDLDFGEIVAGTGRGVTSVIVFRLKNARPLHVIERLRAVLADSAEAIDAGAIVSVEESRHRVRRLPLGG